MGTRVLFHLLAVEGVLELLKVFKKLVTL